MTNLSWVTSLGVAILMGLGLSLSSPVLAQSQDQSLSPLAQALLRNSAADEEKLLSLLADMIAAQPELAPDYVRFALSAAPNSRTAILDSVVVADPDLAARTQLPSGETVASADAAVKAAAAAVPEPGFFDPSSWDGDFSVGASLLTGNTQEQAFNAGIRLNRRGKRWEHLINLVGDYAQNRPAGTTTNVTTQERIFADYQANRDFNERWYGFGRLDFEYDRFTQFAYRIGENVGLGYRALTETGHTWDIEVGLGARHTKFDAAARASTGITGIQTELTGLLASRYRIDLTESLSFGDDTTVTVGSDRTTLENDAFFQATFTSALSGRFSFYVRHDTSVPAAAKKTDTATRASLVYNF